MSSGLPEKTGPSPGEASPSPERPRPVLTLEDLQRWEESGATWRALEVSDAAAVVQLCTCYGEPVDVVRGEARELIEFVRSHRASEP